MKSFHTFCTQYNVLQPFPLSEQLLHSFATYLADQSLASQTGKSYLSALGSIQISLGLRTQPKGPNLTPDSQESAGWDQPAESNEGLTTYRAEWRVNTTHYDVGSRANWSYLDVFRWNWIILGLLWLSTATSSQAKFVAGEK